jgi:hypothetical protein
MKRIVALFLTIILFVSCENEEINQHNRLEENVSFEVLKQETQIDGDLILPVGTKISRISDSQIDIELPSNFKFLLFDEIEGVSFSNKGSYSCTCSANNSCKVIYTTSQGYGCLQSSCSGSCTGKPEGGVKSKRIYGTVNTQSNDLLGDNFIQSGHLTHRGYEIFFNEIANKKLIEFFNFAFSENEYKNSTELIANKGEESTTNVVLQYMGISFSAVVPNFDNEKDSQLIHFKTGPSISCAGNNGCSCTKDKYCILGNCVYFCDGCTTCTMTVIKK